MIKSTAILLVEDSAAHAELISRAFEDDASGHQLYVCSSLRDAQQTIQSKPPGLIIADLNLPDGKGLELISSHSGNPEYPLILMTSFGDEDVAVDALKSGAIDYIVKNPEALEAMPKTAERVLREWAHIKASEKAQHAVLQKEHEQSEILNTMLDGIITIDETGRILTFNNAAETLFGFSAAEVIRQNVKILMPDSISDKHDGILQHYLNTGEAPVMGVDGGVEIKAKHKKNGLFDMRISVAELSKGSDGKRRFISSCHDLTRIKEQEEQFRRSQKMEALGKLTGGVAHDYNNMLGIVLGYAELVESMLGDRPDLVEYIQEIRRAGDRGAKLTKKLLTFSRQTVADAEKMNIGALLLEEQHMLEKTLTARIELDIDLAENLWSVYLGSGELEDAIVNMCINAMHAMDGKGQLIIKTSNLQLNESEARSLNMSEREYVVLSITDSGCGMSEEVQDKIFDPFFTTKGDKGTGLGLSQVYGFIERSKGSIRINSEVGRGTCFTLYFPRYDVVDTNTISEELSEDDDFRGNATILVVDDELALLKLTSENLSLQGYKVHVAENAEQALEILENETVDLLFSDVIMPGMDGYQLAALVQERYPEIKIQLASGFSDNRHLNMVDQTLNQNLLHKPIQSQTLFRRIRELLK